MKRLVFVLLIALVSCTPAQQSYPYPAPINNFPPEPHRIETFVIEGPSMEPTFVDGQNVSVDFDYYRDANISQGEIVAFKFDQSDQYYVKRVIALAKDRLEFTDAGILLNGNVLAEPYTNHAGVYKPSLLLLKELELNNQSVPDGTVIVLGDARDNSVDSATYGPIKVEYIKGKVLQSEQNAASRER